MSTTHLAGSSIDSLSKRRNLVVSILSDSEIEILAKRKKMIEPFVPHIVREEEGGRKVLSYGLGSYGYDVRLSGNEFYLFTPGPDGTSDPKNFDSERVLKKIDYVDDECGKFYYLPPHSYCLGVTKEKLKLPADVLVIACNKSTYARCGINVAIAAAEAAWSGYLTLEIANLTPTYNKVYIDEGICQLLFFRGAACKTTYQDRVGKYQGQPEQVVFAQV